MIEFEYTNNQAATGESRDRNACTVNALATAANVPWEVAHEAMTKAGRKRHRGISMALALDRLHNRGWEVRRIKHWTGRLETFDFTGSRRVTLKTFLRLHPRGRFLVRKRGHAFAVIDGVVRDWQRNPPRCIITGAWIVRKIDDQPKDSLNEPAQQVSISAQL